MYKIGSKFRFRNYNFILSFVGIGMVNLIDMNSGSRWGDSIEVKSTIVTENELRRLIGNSWVSEFVGIDNDFNNELTFEEMEEGKIYKLTSGSKGSRGGYIKLNGDLFYITRSALREQDRFHP